MTTPKGGKSRFCLSHLGKSPNKCLNKPFKPSYIMRWALFSFFIFYQVGGLAAILHKKDDPSLARGQRVNCFAFRILHSSGDPIGIHCLNMALYMGLGFFLKIWQLLQFFFFFPPKQAFVQFVVGFSSHHSAKIVGPIRKPADHHQSHPKKLGPKRKTADQHPHHKLEVFNTK
jgi:hypothetical protein